MTCGVAVVRPEPGNRRTTERLRALDLDVLAVPLFATRAVAWRAPDPADFDALLFTSAAAVRLAGPDLARVAGLPVVAVGAATAEVARQAGLHVILAGDAGATEAAQIARSHGLARLLHLAGRDRVDAGASAVVVYASDALPVPATLANELAGRVVLLHSPRIAAAVARIADPSRTGIAALSPAVRQAAGAGWARDATAAEPSDAALIAIAHRLAIDPAPWPADKAA